MKHVIALVPMMLAHLGAIHAQTGSGSMDHAHRGFHLTVGLGPVFGHIHDKASGQVAPGVNGTFEAQYKGTGVGLDLRIGGAIKENLVLTGDITSKVISAPQISIGGSDYSTTEDLSIGESTYGVGITYFVMPANLSLGATVGAGAYTFMDSKSDTNIRSDFGFSGAVRVGKTWWVGRAVNLGVGLSYSYTRAPNNEAGLEETLWGDRLLATALFMLH